MAGKGNSVPESTKDCRQNELQHKLISDLNLTSHKQCLAHCSSLRVPLSLSGKLSDSILSVSGHTAEDPTCIYFSFLKFALPLSINDLKSTGCKIGM
jgi:hypothetical protein